ncbi:hypothetical protein [Agromyces sp. M3QZ16-3]|uniref:hypothetical protein n=1 Tax=Agromyces sp. M3QZ16-3 TaxID=3447585 RepID=UPI003F692F46
MNGVPAPTDAAPAPFTMVVGDPNALVCEGDACVIPSAVAVAAVEAGVATE